MSLTVVPEMIEFFAHVAIGEVSETITRQRWGRVKFKATYWFARFYEANGLMQAEPGTAVRVIGREGLTLLVVSADDQRVYPLTSRPERPEGNQVGWMQELGFRLATWLS